jgi:flagellin FlaB
MIELSEDEDRGQVGIGTLIVFIAMVLVAAIAAGVLINTAGFLQTQASDTGQESTQQVADALTVQTAVGKVGVEAVDNDSIGEIRIGVQPAAGANDINLAEVTMQYVSDQPESSEFANIVVGNTSSIDQNQSTGDTDPTEIRTFDNESQFNVTVIKAENPQDIVMSDNSDRYEIVIPLNDSTDKFAQEALEPLKEGSEVEITITTGTGSQTTVFLQVPDSLSAEDEGDTVNI